VELELHQLELRYEGIRKRAPVAERQLVGSLAEIGQQLPIIVVGEAERFILIDGYKRVRALKRLAHEERLVLKHIAHEYFVLTPTEPSDE
jgi:ParB-like chromosome segregation protein Spo0J